MSRLTLLAIAGLFGATALGAAPAAAESTPARVNESERLVRGTRGKRGTSSAGRVGGGSCSLGRSPGTRARRRWKLRRRARSRGGR